MIYTICIFFIVKIVQDINTKHHAPNHVVESTPLMNPPPSNCTVLYKLTVPGVMIA